MTKAALFYILAAILLISHAAPALSADEDPLQDFCVALSASEQQQILGSLTFNGLPCKPAANVQSSDFASEQLRQPANFTGNLGSAGTFGGINTQGLSIARIDYKPKGINPPHVLPRATEVLYLARGTLLVSFIATAPSNKFFYKTIYPSDLFVFPHSLVHFQFNPNESRPALAIAALNSQNPGASQVAAALFAANPPLPKEVLEATLGVDNSELNHLIASVQATLM